MPREGTRIYCKNCDDFTTCKAISPTELFEKYHRRLEDDKYEDIKWFRRGRMCLNCGEKFLTAEVNEDFISELVKLRDAYTYRISKSKRTLMRRCREFSRRENIRKEFAEELIRRSAYWDHPTYSIVHAPGHADRVYMHRLGWAVDFGANTFLPGMAIERCVNHILERLQDRDLFIMRDKLISDLSRIISGCVADHNGEEYYGYYPIDYGYLTFGTQLISLHNAADYIISLVDKGDIFL